MTLLAGPMRRQTNINGATPLVATSNDGVLPFELLFEILLCVPVKPACRLRAVCRSWRSLLSHPSFIAAHKARHPLVTVSRYGRNYVGRTIDVYLTDTSGHTVKQVSAGYGTSMKCTHPGLVCVVGEDKSIRVHDPATGAVSILPSAADDHVRFVTLGQTATTGESKALSTVTRYEGGERVEVVWKVLTLGSGRWRDIQSPPTSFQPFARHMAIISGVLYIMSASCREIAALDLEKEQWQPNPMQGPAPRPGKEKVYVSLAELKGRLVVVRDYVDVSMELWFLMDADRVTWCKQYAIDDLYDGSCYRGAAAPLWMSEGEKILFWLWRKNREGKLVAFMRTYDVKTRTYADGEDAECRSDFGVYKGSLLTAP